jgi:uracil-DNA glycosylase family 4
MIFDPRDKAGPFGRLFHEVRQCKEARTCASLPIRSYYFEPNLETADAWRANESFLGKIDLRVVFVCESPGPSGRGRETSETRRCWAESPRDRRFQKVRESYGFQNCYITNTVKCGVRQGARHTDAEVSACIGFLVKELDLICPMVAVGVGGNAVHTLRRWALPRLTAPPVLFEITHYSTRRNPWEAWDREFPELQRLLSRLKPLSQWE